MGAANHDETTGPDKTPDPQGKNTTVPDPDQAQNAPIPFAHDDASGSAETPDAQGKNTTVPDPDQAQNAPIPFAHDSEGDAD